MIRTSLASMRLPTPTTMLPRLARNPLRALAAAAALALLAVPACSGGDGGGGGGTQPNPVTAVNVTSGSSVVRVGTTIQLTATALAQGSPVSGKTASWSSANTSLATVSSSGLVTGVAPGAVTITATVDGVSGSLPVTVTLVPVTSVSVTAPATTVPAGTTLQLTATAKDSAGGALTGRTVTWGSDRNDLATVSASGMLTAVSPGTVHVTATVEGVQGSITVIVAAPAVASVAVVPDTATLVPGQSRPFSAVAKDAAGNVLTGRTVDWSTSNAGVVTVAANGVATGASGGAADVIATVEGKTGSAHVTVVPQVAAQVAVSPRIAVANVGAGVALSASARTAQGDSILLPHFTWTALDAGLNVTSGGVATASAPGTYHVKVTADAASDTAQVAALGPSSILVTAQPAVGPVVNMLAGGTLDVVVAVDMSRVSSTGDLGSMQLNVTFDPSVLAYQTFTQVAHGGMDVYSPSAGTVRVAFAEASPNGSAAFQLVVLRFHVASNAAGARTTFGVTFPAAPTSSGFQAYATPVGVGGSVWVK